MYTFICFEALRRSGVQQLFDRVESSGSSGSWELKESKSRVTSAVLSARVPIDHCLLFCLHFGAAEFSRSAPVYLVCDDRWQMLYVHIASVMLPVSLSVCAV